MSATTLFTVYKHIQPDAQTVEVYGEISVGDETIDIGSDVTVEFDEQEYEVEFDEEDIEELTPREARMLLSALLKHHIEPTLDIVGCSTKAQWDYFRRAVTAMQDLIEKAEKLSKEGAA